jgi:uncharacterized delta-60 repeat protein
MKKQLLTLILGLSLSAYAQEGILDATFGTSGVVKTDDNRDVYATDIQSDGKIVLVGSRYDANGTDAGIFRHNTNGSTDNSFGTNGAVIIDFFGKQDIAKGVKVLADGKILVGAIVTEGTTKKYALVKLNSDGSIDNTFGTAGKVVVSITGATSLGLTTMAVASNGNILLGGTADGFSKAALVIFKSTGELDATFDTDGILQPNSMVEIQSIKVQTDGKILFGGNGSNYATIVRINTDGSLDNTFGTSGKFTNGTITFGGANTYIDLASDGKIIGAFGSFATADINIIKLTSTGTLDAEFGTGGKIIVNAINGNEYPTAIKLQPNGKLLLTGSDGGSANIFLARLNTDGTPDNTFGTNGTTITSVREGGEDNAKAIAVQTDGKIIIAGNQCGGMCTYILLRYNANAVSNPTGLFDVKENLSTYFYPNPATENLHLTLAQNLEIDFVNILNISGQKVKEFAAVTTISVQDLPNGLYFIQVVSNKNTFTQKFIKQ